MNETILKSNYSKRDKLSTNSLHFITPVTKYNNSLGNTAGTYIFNKRGINNKG